MKGPQIMVSVETRDSTWERVMDNWERRPGVSEMARKLTSAVWLFEVEGFRLAADLMNMCSRERVDFVVHYLDGVPIECRKPSAARATES